MLIYRYSMYPNNGMDKVAHPSKGISWKNELDRSWVEDLLKRFSD